MGFGVQLQGKESHEALLRIQDTEIHLLENMRKCVNIRIDSDRKYLMALNQFLLQSQKLEPSSEFTSICSVFQAWDTIIQQTQLFIRHLTENTEDLSTKTLDKLNSLISEKKAAKRYYCEERNRLETEFIKLQEHLQKTQQDYVKTMEKLKLDKQKYEDLFHKGKAGGKFDDAKTKYLRCTMKLHRLHNDYVIGLKEAVLHQTDYLQRTLPSLMDYHQATQQILVQQCKDVLLEYCHHTNWSAEKFSDSYTAAETAVTNIKPDTEYTEFITQNKTDPLSPITFEFDKKLLDSYFGKLACNEIALDDLTVESLHHKKAELDRYLEAENKLSECNKTELLNLQNELDKLSEEVTNEATTRVAKNNYYVTIRASDRLKYNNTELECSMNKHQVVNDLICKPLEELGDAIPFVGLELAELEINPGATQAETTNSTLAGIKSRFKTFNFRKTSSSGPMSPAIQTKDDATNGLTKAGSQADLTDSGEGGIVVGDDGAGDALAGGESYELTTAQQNGVGTTRFRIVSDAGKHGLEDMRWFHGILPRDEVQRLLQNDGDFLVRESKNKKTNEPQYVLSVFWQVPKHFIIQKIEGGWRFEGQVCPTVPELVDFQYSSGEPVTSKSQAILRTPIVKEDWELNNDDIQLEQKIGNGNFGEVFKGIYRPRNLIVAVKTCRDTLSEDQKKKFLGEGRILKQYDHPNIVMFVGIAVQRQPVMIIMEFCSGGALLNFLKAHGKYQPKKLLAQMCRDAAAGMAYLDEKGCIHRDLAARNCLLTDAKVVKISDFGMSREEETYTVSDGMKQIPIKWTAPEALNYGRYTSLCDVWSFGILMWEAFSGGTTPYLGMTNAQAREKVDDGYRMPPPDGTPDAVYRLMLKCWEYEPDKRPHFSEIVREFKVITSAANHW